MPVRLDVGGINRLPVTRPQKLVAHAVPIPNPDHVSVHPLTGGFARTLSEPIVTYDETEDRIWATQVIEDTARDRLLMIAYARTIGDPDNLSFGRKLYLLTATEPLGTWTRINAAGAPFLDVGAEGKWDAGNVFGAAMCIRGDTLYVAYSAQDASLSPKHRIGLATADLTDETPVATKVDADSYLELGTTPYQALAVGLWYDNGWVLHAWQQRDSNNNYQIPRRFTNSAFTVDGWACDSRLPAVGSFTGTALDSSVMSSIAKMDGDNYLGAIYASGPPDNIYNMFHVNYTATGVIASFMGAGIRATDGEGDWDKTLMAGPTFLYWRGTWYVFYCGNDTTEYPWAEDNEIGAAAWDTTETVAPTGTGNRVATDTY